MRQEIHNVLLPKSNNLIISTLFSSTDGKATRVILRTAFAEFGMLFKDHFQCLMRKYKRRDTAFYSRMMDARAVVDHPGSAPSCAVAPPKA